MALNHLSTVVPNPLYGRFAGSIRSKSTHATVASFVKSRPLADVASADEKTMSMIPKTPFSADCRAEIPSGPTVDG